MDDIIALHSEGAIHGNIQFLGIVGEMDVGLGYYASPVFQATFCLDTGPSPAILREVEHAANITIAVMRHIICKRERLMCFYSGVWDVVNLFVILLFACFLGQERCDIGITALGR